MGWRCVGIDDKSKRDECKWFVPLRWVKSLGGVDDDSAILNADGITDQRFARRAARGNAIDIVSAVVAGADDDLVLGANDTMFVGADGGGGVEFIVVTDNQDVTAFGELIVNAIVGKIVRFAGVERGGGDFFTGRCG